MSSSGNYAGSAYATDEGLFDEGRINSPGNEVYQSKLNKSPRQQDLFDVKYNIMHKVSAIIELQYI